MSDHLETTLIIVVTLLIISFLGLVLFVLDSRLKARQDQALASSLERAKALGQPTREEILRRPHLGDPRSEASDGSGSESKA